MPLNDSAIKAAKPADKPKKLFDERGLFLLLNPNGAKLWRVKYRFGRQGSELLGLGRYPEITLKQAREHRDEIRKPGRATGIDPERRAQKPAKAALSGRREFRSLGARVVSPVFAAGWTP
ncbi:MAG: Arm DNA-binding domain-containing protein [Candidatus Competibacter sp.]